MACGVRAEARKVGRWRRECKPGPARRRRDRFGRAGVLRGRRPSRRPFRDGHFETAISRRRFAPPQWPPQDEEECGADYLPSLHPEERLRSDPQDRVSKPRLEGRNLVSKDETPVSKDGAAFSGAGGGIAVRGLTGAGGNFTSCLSGRTAPAARPPFCLGCLATPRNWNGFEPCMQLFAPAGSSTAWRRRK